MAPKADIYDYRVLSAKGKVFVTTAEAQAVYAAADAGCQVISMSLGETISHPSIKEAVKIRNVIMVCVAGNEGDKYPLMNEIRHDSFAPSLVSLISPYALLDTCLLSYYDVWSLGI